MSPDARSNIVSAARLSSKVIPVCHKDPSAEKLCSVARDARVRTTDEKDRFIPLKIPQYDGIVVTGRGQQTGIGIEVDIENAHAVIVTDFEQFSGCNVEHANFRCAGD